MFPRYAMISHKLKENPLTCLELNITPLKTSEEFL
jgi:hypothetical protein